MKHKILIDCVALLAPLTGIGRYNYEVTDILKDNRKLNVNYFYGFYSKELIVGSSNQQISMARKLFIKVPFMKRIIRKLIKVLSYFSSKKYDLYWQPNFIPQEGIKAKKTVTTVHDFSFILHKEHHPRERIEYFEKNFFQNIYRSDAIITGSNFSKNEILKFLDFPEEKIHVIYHGIDHNIFKVRDDNQVDFQLPNKFIFSVGSIEPRKNLVSLLRAYNNLEQDLKEEYKLVLAGFKGWENKEIMELIEKDKKNIFYLGYITDEELSKVYNLASLFVFPSLYEGFGLPPVEAMACGTPVVCSNSSSILEVTSDSAVHFNPLNTYEIQNKIKMVLKNENLQSELVSKGLERARLFTWEKSSKQHYQVFQEVLSK